MSHDENCSDDSQDPSSDRLTTIGWIPKTLIDRGYFLVPDVPGERSSDGTEEAKNSKDERCGRRAGLRVSVRAARWWWLGHSGPPFP